MILTMQSVVTVAATIVLTIAVGSSTLQQAELSTPAIGGANVPQAFSEQFRATSMATPYAIALRPAVVLDRRPPAVTRGARQMLDPETRNVLRVYGAMALPTAAVALVSLKLAIPFGMLALSFGALVLGHLHNKKMRLDGEAHLQR